MHEEIESKAPEKLVSDGGVSKTVEWAHGAREERLATGVTEVIEEEDLDDEDEGDEGDEIKLPIKEVATVRLCVPIRLVIDFRELMQPAVLESVAPPAVVPPSRSKKEPDSYDLSDPFIDDEALLLQDDDAEISVEGFRAFAANSASLSASRNSSGSASSAPKRLKSELPADLRGLVEDFEKKVSSLNLKKSNPGRMPEEVHCVLLELEKKLQNESRATKQKAIQYLCQSLPWSMQTIRGRMRSLRENETCQKELEQLLLVLEKRIDLDICEYHLSLPYNTPGGNVTAKTRDGVTRMKYFMRWELYQDLIDNAAKLDEQLRNKKGDKAGAKARAHTTIFQTIADFWPVSVNVEPKRIEAEYKRRKEIPEVKSDNAWATKSLEAITAKRFTSSGLELLVSCGEDAQWVLCTNLHNNPAFRSALDVFLTTPASKTPASLLSPSPAHLSNESTTHGNTPRVEFKKRKHISSGLSIPALLASEGDSDIDEPPSKIIMSAVDHPLAQFRVLPVLKDGIPIFGHKFCAFPVDDWSSKIFGV